MRNAWKENIIRWHDEPILFVREALKAIPDDWQEDVLNALKVHERIAMKASKGPGKSTTLAWAGLWYLATRPYPKVVATSVTGPNLRDGLWAELGKWLNKSPFLKETFQWSAERIVSKKYPEQWWASARQWSKGADPAQQADTLAGLHADYMMFLIDEAGGIPDAVMAAAEAGLANADHTQGREARLVIAGNPTNLEGPLWNAYTKERKKWYIKEITGDPDDPRRSKRVGKAWARAVIEKYGKDHPWVLVNVFGQFPPGSSNSFIAHADVQNAMGRNLQITDYSWAPKILGVDVARFGDDRTVFYPRQGRVAFRPWVHRNLTVDEVAGALQDVMGKWKPHAVFIDATGLGQGVADIVKGNGWNVTSIYSSGKAEDPRYLNKRAECWGRMADWTRNEPSIWTNGELLGEMASIIYKFSDQGQYKVESKQDLKKRGLASPDLADALSLTFAQVVPIPEDAGALFNTLRRKIEEEGGSGGSRVHHDYDPFSGAGT